MADNVTDDLANYRGAMTWASDAGHSPLALELACNLRTYFWDRNMFRESLSWLTSALDRVDDDASPFVAVGTAYALTESSNIGGDSPISALAERARRLLESSNDDLSRGLLSNALSGVEMSVNAKRADELMSEAAILLRKANDRGGSAGPEPPSHLMDHELQRVRATDPVACRRSGILVEIRTRKRLYDAVQASG